MLADKAEFVVGVDTHKQTHSIAVVATRDGAVSFRSTVATSPSNLRRLIDEVCDAAPTTRSVVRPTTASARRRAFQADRTGHQDARGLRRMHLTASGEFRLQPDVASISLRVTSVFRPEDGIWKLVHRHADPITTPQPPESVLQR
jgi:hypothetical protein